MFHALISVLVGLLVFAASVLLFFVSFYLFSVAIELLDRLDMALNWKATATENWLANILMGLLVISSSYLIGAKILKVAGL